MSHRGGIVFPRPKGDGVTDEDGLPEDPPWDSAEPCPQCGTDMKPLVWGYPLHDGELMEAANRGDVFLGGCVLPERPIPQWRCPGCGHEAAMPVNPADA